MRCAGFSSLYAATTPWGTQADAIAVSHPRRASTRPTRSRRSSRRTLAEETSCPTGTCRKRRVSRHAPTPSTLSHPTHARPLSPPSEPFFPGVPLLPSSAPFSPLLDAPRHTTPPTVRTPLSDPHSPRSLLFVWLLQRGTLVDALSGVRGASAALRRLPAAGQARARLAREDPHGRRTLPQLGLGAAFPPTFLAHGTEDAIVHVEESRHFCGLLRSEGVECVLWEVEGGGHGFDTEGGWKSSPGGGDEDLTRRKDEGLARIIPWLVEHFD